VAGDSEGRWYRHHLLSRRMLSRCSAAHVGLRIGAHRGPICLTLWARCAGHGRQEDTCRGSDIPRRVGRQARRRVHLPDARRPDQVAREVPRARGGNSLEQYSAPQHCHPDCKPAEQPQRTRRPKASTTSTMPCHECIYESRLHQHMPRLCLYPITAVCLLDLSPRAVLTDITSGAVSNLQPNMSRAQSFNSTCSVCSVANVSQSSVA
jgi:hypothetical protein